MCDYRFTICYRIAKLEYIYIPIQEKAKRNKPVTRNGSEEVRTVGTQDVSQVGHIHGMNVVGGG